MTIDAETFKRMLSTSDVSSDGFVMLAPELAKLNEGFKESYFDDLVKLEKNYFWFKARNKLIIQFLNRYFSQAKSILEIGCGSGNVLLEIEKNRPDMNMFGSDIFVKGLNITKKRATNSYLFQMDAETMSFENVFDVICAFDVVEHIENDELVLKNLYRAVKPNGGILLTVPQHPGLWSQVDEYACHKRRYKIKELQEKVQKAGFRLVDTTSFSFFLSPLLYLSRKNSKKEFDSHSEFKINSLLNNIFYSVQMLECYLLKIGIRFPFGGSRLVVAKKEI